MIQSVKITNPSGESVELELRNLGPSGFLIQDIDGLDPCKATINSTELASSDGSKFNSARLAARSLIFSIAFGETPSIEANRLKCYQYFPIKREVRIELKTDTRWCWTYGHVESNEIDIFSKAEAALITVICNDPYFYAMAPQITEFGSIESCFEFPFSNESLTQNLLVMDEIHSDTTKAIVYQGDASVGFVMTFHALGNASNLKVYDLLKRQTTSIDSAKLVALTGSDIVQGDDIVISSLRGSKYVYLVRGGVTYNILNCLGKDAFWLTLDHGDNAFAYTADSGLQNILCKLESQIIYEGI